MRFSDQVERITSSKTAEIRNQAAALRADGTPIIDMSAGDPDFDSPRTAIDGCVDALRGGETHYTVSKGLPELRTRIAEKLSKENGIDTDRQRIVVTPGAKQALFESIFSLVGEGDDVVILDPSWVSYRAIVRMAGGNVIGEPLNADAGFALGESDLAAAVDDDTEVLILNTPVNPTGAVFSKEALTALRDLAVEHDFWVIADEIYEKYVYDDAEHHSIGSLEGMSDRTVTINGFSKAYAMTGWRLGYLSAPADLVDRSVRVQSHTVSSAVNFVQHGGYSVLEDDDGFIEDIVSTFETRRDILVDALDDAGVAVETPRGAFYAFLPLAEEDDIEVCKRILSEERAATIPGSGFGLSGYLRLAYTTDTEAIKEGIERLQPYLDAS